MSEGSRYPLTSFARLATILDARPSYVASVLQDSGLLSGYFDLYTSTAAPMNVYSKFFAHKLGFKDEEAVRESVELLEHYYRQFEEQGDRAGQHHVLMLALTMFDRARWIGKLPGAEAYRQWLTGRLAASEEEPPTSPPVSRL